MMNNWYVSYSRSLVQLLDITRWFRVAIHKEDSPSGSILRFEHPTLAGGRSGGWMEASVYGSMRLVIKDLNPCPTAFKVIQFEPSLP